jgi:hypothetical protein
LSPSRGGAEHVGVEKHSLEIDRIGRQSRGGSDRCHKTKNVAFATRDESHLRLTEPGSALGKPIEHRLKVESRTTDQLEYIGSRGLLFTRLVQLAG